MDRLNRKYLLKTSPETLKQVEKFPIRVLLFGEGKFSRAFSCWIIQQMNNQGLFQGRILIVQSSESGEEISNFEEQDYLFTVMARGEKEGKVRENSLLITSVAGVIRVPEHWHMVLETAENPDIQVIMSNVSESGLEFLQESQERIDQPHSYSARLTAWLYRRFTCFEGADQAGVVILPHELMKGNGDILKANISRLIHRWKLPSAFRVWVYSANCFCSTLSDRIVSGFSKIPEPYFRRLGYRDTLLTFCEPYYLMVIHGNQKAEQVLPFRQAGLNVLMDEHTIYRDKKIRYLNGSQTLMAAVGLVHGLETVRDFLQHPQWQQFLYDCLMKEIDPVIDLPSEEKTAYMRSVLERFRNPCISHYLMDIACNSAAKVRERLLPTLFDFAEQYQRLPERIVMAFSCVLYIYEKGKIGENTITLSVRYREFEFREEPFVLQEIQRCRSARLDIWVQKILAATKLWHENLNVIPGLKDAVIQNIEDMRKAGVLNITSESALKLSKVES